VTVEVTVVKCGGAAGVSTDHVCADVAELVRRGDQVVLAHGGSAEIERLATGLGVPQRRLVAPDGVSARYTDAATLEVVTLALAGAVKPRLVAALGAQGVAAIGLTGLDGGLLLARRKRAHRAVLDGRLVVVRDNHSGRVAGVNERLLRTLLAEELVPVVSPPALAEDGAPVNVDADRAAAAVAAALGATRLVLLTGAPGVLRDAADESSALEVCPIPSTGRPPQWAHGGMALKLVAAREALEGGVPEVVVADGRVERPVLDALEGAGTRIVLEAEAAVTA
jgi:[amino group carrier protein]-L-2-aminoadipate/L-glutamate 6-kinase